MRWFLLLVLLGAMLPVAHGQTDAATLLFDKDMIDGASRPVDLMDDAGDRVKFVVDTSTAKTPFGGSVSAVVIAMSCTCGVGGAAESMELGTSKAGSTYTAVLNVNNRDLLVGTWDVVARGALTNPTSDPIEVTKKWVLFVTANDGEAPIITINNEDAGKVLVSPSQPLGIGIDDDLLRKVTYQMDGMPRAFEVGAPYTFEWSDFQSGENRLVLIASDRAGHATSKTLTVIADGVAPDVEYTFPEKVFIDVPNPIRVSVLEDSDFNVRISLVGASAEADFVADDERQEAIVTITPVEAGNQSMEVTVTDLLGNTWYQTAIVNVTALEADAQLIKAEARSASVVPGEPLPILIHADLGVSPIPVDADVYYGDIFVDTITLEPSETTVHELDLYTVSGPQTRNLTLVTQDGVIELDLDNQVLAFSVEVFAGRVQFGDRVTFHIRATEAGVPTVAVAADGQTYPLTPRDEGLATVYAFSASGLDLYWNPSERVTVFDPADFASDVPGDNGIPALGLPLLLAALAALALARRK